MTESSRRARGPAALARFVTTLALVAIATSARAAPPEIPEVMAELPGWSADRPAAAVRKLEAIVRRAGADPALRAALARQLDAILTGEATPDAKDVALRALATIGDAQSIDAAATLLKDPRLGHLAAAALAVLPDGAEATGLLAAALKDASIADSVRVAVVDALRRRGDDVALIAVTETAQGGVGAVRPAAIAALGAWPRPEAATALASMPPEQLDATSRRTLLDALLMVADARIADDEAPLAKSPLDRAAMLPEHDDDRLAIARLRLLTLDGDDASRLVSFLTDRRGDWRGTALEAVRSGQGRALTALAVGALPKLPADAQAGLIAALGARGDRSARDAVVVAAGSDDARVRVAAIGALRALGDSRDIGTLIDALAAPSPNVADAAAATLIAMPGADVDAALGDHIVAADGAPEEATTRPVIARLLDVLAQRPGRAPVDAIVRALRQSPPTRLDAIEAMEAHPAPHFVMVLGGIATGQHSPDLRAPAFAAWIACLGAPGAKPPEWATAALPGAMAAATDDGERAAVAALAARFPERASIEFLSPLVAGAQPQPSVVQRAARDSILAIARALPPDQHREALAAIRGTLEGAAVDDTTFRAAAANATNAIERDLDFVRSWQVAGPFTKQGVGLADLFDTTFAAEAEPDGAAVFWRELAGAAIEPSGVVNLAKFLGAGDNRVAYLRTRLFSPKPQRVRLELGSDDGVKAWLNGTLVHAKNTPRGLRAGEDVVDELDLDEGWNTLVLKVTQGSGDWSACCRVRGADGLAADGVHAFFDPIRAAPLPGATVLLGDSGLSAWRHRDGGEPRWTFADGVATVSPGAGDILSRDSFGDCTLHVEFLCPDNPPEVTGQHRSNSGIFLQDRYEVQVLDSFGEAPAKDRVGAIYGKHVPAHDVARRPGQWQDALIDFTAPRYDTSDPAAPKKIANARMTVWLNGVRIHDDVEVDGVTTTGVAEQPGDGPVRLQDHGNPVRFRNVWIVPRSGWEGPKAAGFAPLFDGTSLAGWTQRGGKASFTVADGAIVGATRPNEHNSFLCSREFGDFVLELEFLADDAANSGIQFRSAARPEEGGERVIGYQCEIDPSNRGWTAGVYDEARRGWLAPPTTPLAKAAYRPREWNRLRIEARGPETRTWLNEVPVSVLWDGLSPRGFFGLQVHGVGDRVEPLTVRWRDVRVREFGGR